MDTTIILLEMFLILCKSSLVVITLYMIGTKAEEWFHSHYVKRSDLRVVVGRYYESKR